MMKIKKLLADGWREEGIGIPDWRWFIRGEENAYFYSLTGELFFAKRWRDVVADMPCWEDITNVRYFKGTAKIRSARVMRLLFMDPTTLKLKPSNAGRLREGSAGFQSNLFRNIRESL